MANTFRVENYRSTNTLTMAVTAMFGLLILCNIAFIGFSFGLMLSPDWAIDTEEGSLPVWLMFIGLVGIG
ncbi:MAG: hypothetical protein ACT4O9_13260 [Blastocatellia bacterium]